MIYYDVKAFHYMAIFFIFMSTSIWYFTDLRNSKTLKAFFLFGMFMAPVSGYYLSHRLAYTFGPKLPYWLIAKYVLWGVVTIILPLFSKLKPQYNKWYFGINIFLFFSLTALVIYKPF